MTETNFQATATSGYTGNSASTKRCRRKKVKLHFLASSNKLLFSFTSKNFKHFGEWSLGQAMAFLCLYVSVNHDSFCHFVDLCRIKGRGELPSKGKHISEKGIFLALLKKCEVHYNLDIH